MRLQRHDLHTLTGSYALDALQGEELDEFERHLNHCSSCATEIRGLRETAARLSMAAAEPPRPRCAGGCWPSPNGPGSCRRSPTNGRPAVVPAARCAGPGASGFRGSR